MTPKIFLGSSSPLAFLNFCDRQQQSDFSRDVEKGEWFAALRREPTTYI
jgi:hypothetical protein